MELAIRGSGARDPGDSTYFTVPVPPKVAPKETILLAQVRVVPSNTHHHAPWPTYGVEALATRLRFGRRVGRHQFKIEPIRLYRYRARVTVTHPIRSL